MGILDWLMFWKKDDEPGADDYKVEGCFTLPDEVEPDADPNPIDSEGDCVPDLALSDGDAATEA